MPPLTTLAVYHSRAYAIGSSEVKLRDLSGSAGDALKTNFAADLLTAFIRRGDVLALDILCLGMSSPHRCREVSLLARLSVFGFLFTLLERWTRVKITFHEVDFIASVLSSGGFKPIYTAFKAINLFLCPFKSHLVERT